MTGGNDSRRIALESTSRMPMSMAPILSALWMQPLIAEMIIVAKIPKIEIVYPGARRGSAECASVLNQTRIPGAIPLRNLEQFTFTDI